jgi:excisionase family DNA binding protein
MENPFNSLEKRLANIEDILFDIKHSPKEDFSNKRYSIKEAAAILRVIPLTIRNYIKNGNLKAEQLGRKYYILHSDLFNSFNEVKSLKYKR